jgi:hypothetical protein
MKLKLDWELLAGGFVIGFGVVYLATNPARAYATVKEGPKIGKRNPEDIDPFEDPLIGEMSEDQIRFKNINYEQRKYSDCKAWCGRCKTGKEDVCETCDAQCAKYQDLSRKPHSMSIHRSNKPEQGIARREVDHIIQNPIDSLNQYLQKRVGDLFASPTINPTIGVRPLLIQ